MQGDLTKANTLQLVHNQAQKEESTMCSALYNNR